MIKIVLLSSVFFSAMCFASEIVATITNNTKNNITIASQTSTASIIDNKIFSQTTQSIPINFNTFATPRASILIYDADTNIIRKQLLIVLNGSFSVSTVVCVPISSCSPGNPMLSNDHKSFHFTLD
jgi:hypothetical protein